MPDQYVYKPKHKVPSGFAPNQGAGPPGRPSSNQIRMTIRAKLYGTSVAPATDRSKNPKRNTQGTPTKTPSGRTSDKLANTGSSAGPSHNAYDARPRKRKVVRSQVAG